MSFPLKPEAPRVIIANALMVGIVENAAIYLSKSRALYHDGWFEIGNVQ